MTFKQACDLYNGDQVIIKSTGEIGIVKNAWTTSNKSVLIDVVVGNKLIREMLHTELN